MSTEVPLLDIKLLRLLDQLYATRSVTRSAEALGQSQPTVSIWLARLRKELSDPLFVRTAEGMLPTPRTDALMPTVREVLAGLQRLASAAGLRVLPCPFEIPCFTVKQYWHAQYHDDAATRWLRGVCVELFMKSGAGPYFTGVSSY